MAAASITSLLCCQIFTSFLLLSRAYPWSNIMAQPNAAATPPLAEKVALDLVAPLLVPLRRESIPILRKGKVVSYKTSFSGVLSVGYPEPQEFRVVFDTGSGHVVIPSVNCESETCMLHQRYNHSKSESSARVNVDGKAVPDGATCDQVTIGFGTGKITGSFVRDVVCLGGSRSISHSDTVSTDVARSNGASGDGRCVTVNMVTAGDMSPQPFKKFTFDGILGMGLKSLALSKEFSFFEMLTTQGEKPPTPHFGVFLGDDLSDDSEIAIGGHNPARLLEPLSWVPVPNAELGHWQVEILSIRVGGRKMSMCDDGTCRGIMDTGTSHLGIPGPFDKEVTELSTTVAPEDMEDCRFASAPVVEIELPGVTLTLYPEDYMRKLPLDEGVQVSSTKGVTLDNSPDAAIQATTTTTTEADGIDAEDKVGMRYCRPKFMAVNLPAPLGPKLFILGEPVLHRYYSVYDWKNHRIGVGASTSQRLNPTFVAADAAVVGASGDGASQDSVVLLQASVQVQCGDGDMDGECDDEEEETVLVQITICVSKSYPAASSDFPSQPLLA